MDLNRNDMLIDASGVGVTSGGDTSSSSSSSSSSNVVSSHLPLIAKEISKF